MMNADTVRTGALAAGQAGRLKCLRWHGPNNGEDGYGKVSVNGLRRYVHRFAWEVWNERPVPDGLFVCHSCDNPECYNPLHLFVGTNRDNMHDAIRKGRLKGTILAGPETNAERRRRRIVSGLCARCGNRPPQSERKHCSRCLVYCRSIDMRASRGRSPGIPGLPKDDSWMEFLRQRAFTGTV